MSNEFGGHWLGLTCLLGNRGPLCQRMYRTKRLTKCYTHHGRAPCLGKKFFLKARLNAKQHLGLTLLQDVSEGKLASKIIIACLNDGHLEAIHNAL